MSRTYCCPRCGRTSETQGVCAPCKREENRARGSAHRRGYTRKHQQLRRLAIAAQPWCTDCRTTENLTADHIVPLSQGGTNVLSNYQVRCRSCNSARANRERSQRFSAQQTQTRLQSNSFENRFRDAQRQTRAVLLDREREDPEPGFREKHSQSGLAKQKEKTVGDDDANSRNTREVVAVRFAESERAQVERAAALLNLPFSAYVRRSAVRTAHDDLTPKKPAASGRDFPDCAGSCPKRPEKTEPVVVEPEPAAYYYVDGERVPVSWPKVSG